MAQVLVVEDSSSKFEALLNVLQSSCRVCEITHASTIIEAEEAIVRGGWDLIVLDISMDIAPSSLGSRSRGQANIGGLSIAQRMFLLEREAPTIIVTAFDSFAAPTMGAGSAEIMGFEEVKRRAEESLGESLIACLQYNSPTWKDSMAAAISKVII